MKAAAALGGACALVLMSALAPAQEPWEPEPIGAIAPLATSPAPGYHPVADLALAAIGFYQTEIGPHSISRCLYAESCSQFARGSVQRHGMFVGLLYFMDRFFFRENQAAFDHHGWVITEQGRLKLDDGSSQF